MHAPRRPRWHSTRACVLTLAVVAVTGAGGSAVAASTQRASVHAARSTAAQFRGVRWRVLPLPSLCGLHHELHMAGRPIYPPVQVGEFTVRPAWRGVTREDVTRSLRPGFGPLLGARGAAVTFVACANTGGTIDGTLATMLVVEVHRGARVSALAVLPSTVGIASPEIATFLRLVRVRPRQLTVEEAFYGEGDASCCATGRATTVWDLVGTRFVPHTRITRDPSVRDGSTRQEPRSWVRIDRRAVHVLP